MGELLEALTPESLPPLKKRDRAEKALQSDVEVIVIDDDEPNNNNAASQKQSDVTESKKPRKRRGRRTQKDAAQNVENKNGEDKNEERLEENELEQKEPSRQLKLVELIGRSNVKRRVHRKGQNDEKNAMPCFMPFVVAIRKTSLDQESWESFMESNAWDFERASVYSVVAFLTNTFLTAECPENGPNKWVLFNDVIWSQIPFYMTLAALRGNYDVGFCPISEKTKWRTNYHKRGEHRKSSKEEFIFAKIMAIYETHKTVENALADDFNTRWPGQNVIVLEHGWSPSSRPEVMKKVFETVNPVTGGVVAISWQSSEPSIGKEFPFLNKCAKNACFSSHTFYVRVKGKVRSVVLLLIPLKEKKRIQEARAFSDEVMGERFEYLVNGHFDIRALSWFWSRLPRCFDEMGEHYKILKDYLHFVLGQFKGEENLREEAIEFERIANSIKPDTPCNQESWLERTYEDFVKSYMHGPESGAQDTREEVLMQEISTEHFLNNLHQEKESGRVREDRNSPVKKQSKKQRSQEPDHDDGLEPMDLDDDKFIGDAEESPVENRPVAEEMEEGDDDCLQESHNETNGKDQKTKAVCFEETGTLVALKKRLTDDEDFLWKSLMESARNKKRFEKSPKSGRGLLVALQAGDPNWLKTTLSLAGVKEILRGHTKEWITKTQGSLTTDAHALASLVRKRTLRPA